MNLGIITIAYFFIIYRVSCVKALVNNGDEKVLSNHIESARFQRKWISELFHEAKTSFHMDSEVGDECKRDFDMYELHLKNQSVWAVRSEFS